MNPVFPIDTFIVINKTVLNTNDRKILNLLYQPIVGCNAINLYMTFWSYLDKFEITSSILTHHDLMNNMQIKLEVIIESLHKLEALGLVKTYLKKGKVNNYLYEIYSPVSAYDFFKDPILSTLLNNNIGDIEYKKTKKYFEITNINKDGYSNITYNFNDVFEIVDIVKNDSDNIRKINNINISFEPTIELNQVLFMIPNGMLDYRTITKNVKEIIYKLALLYNYNNKQMSEIIINSLSNKRINIDKLQEQCRNIYRFDNDNRLPSAIYKNQPEYLKTKLTNISKKDKLINMFETMSPYDFLASKNKCKPTSVELDILKYLLIDMELTPGVVNVLIDYVLKINDNKLTKKYISTIAAQWKRNNINTVLDAIELASKEHKKVVKKQEKKELPKWFDEDIKSEELSLEEQEKLKQKLKDMRS